MTSHAMRGLVASALLLPAASFAATVAHWELEPGAFLLDSAGSSHLTRSGAVDEVTYPSSGRGGSFPAGHTGGAEFNSTGEYLGATITPLNGSFTVEAFINHDNNAQLQNFGYHWGAVIAGAFSGNDINSNAWDLEIRLDGRFDTVPGELLMGLGGVAAIDSNLFITPGKDYFVAAAVTLGSTGEVTFYAQNLTDGGPLESSTRAINLLSIPNFSTVWIGETPDGYNFLFDGIIDEVRLSSTALTGDELLVAAVPVPAGLPLLASAFGALGWYGRRRRAR